MLYGQLYFHTTMECSRAIIPAMVPPIVAPRPKSCLTDPTTTAITTPSATLRKNAYTTRFLSSSRQTTTACRTLLGDTSARQDTIVPVRKSSELKSKPGRANPRLSSSSLVNFVNRASRRGRALRVSMSFCEASEQGCVWNQCSTSVSSRHVFNPPRKIRS